MLIQLSCCHCLALSQYPVADLDCFCCKIYLVHLALEKPESDGIYALQDNGGRRYDVSWFGENDSDAESVDSEEEDPLRYRGILLNKSIFLLITLHMIKHKCDMVALLDDNKFRIRFHNLIFQISYSISIYIIKV